MKKHFLIILLLFVHSVFSLPTINSELLVNITKKSLYTLGFNTVLFGKFTFLFYQLRIEQNKKRLDIINTKKEYREIVQELLETYAPNHKDIKLYETDQNRYTDVFADYRDVYLNASMKNSLKNKEDEKHLLAQAVVGHEIGHVINDHLLKMVVVDSIISLSNFYVMHKLLQRPLLQNRYFGLITAGAMGLKNIVDIASSSALSRSYERQADFHVIKNCKDSKILKAMACHWQKRTDKDTHSFLQRIFKRHPSYQERADYFSQAAQALEKNTNNA